MKLNACLAAFRGSVFQFFRPIGGGIIEASPPAMVRMAWRTFFRPIGGGIIEAEMVTGLWRVLLRSSSALLGAASLKHIATLPAVIVNSQVLPPYWGRHH